MPAMAGHGTRVLLAMAVALALLGAEPTGLRSEPDRDAAVVSAPTTQNSATGVHADQGAHASTVAAAARSIPEAIEHWLPTPAMIGVIVLLLPVVPRPYRRLRQSRWTLPPPLWWSGTASLRAPPVVA